MVDSILDSVKDKIAGGSIHDHFDGELVDDINAVLVDLRQVGIGPEEGFHITGSDETWADFVGDNLQMQRSVSTLVALKVRLIFDPPTSSAIAEAIKNNIDRLEWRLNANYEIGV